MIRPTAIAAFAAALCAACAPAPEAPVAQARPNVLLVTIDTLRADHTSLHGYAKPTTPFLEELAAEGVRFDRAYGTSSWTVPSVASLISGKLPSTHGIVSGFVQDQEVVEQQVLGAEHVLLAEALRDAGYWTVGVTANGHLAPELGFAQGFDRYEHLGFAAFPSVRDALDPLIDELRGAEPWFLWVHAFDPHGPYLARGDVAAFLDDPQTFDPALANELTRIVSLPDLLDAGVRAGSESHRHLLALYDAEIRFVDDGLRELFAAIGVGTNDLVLVTADHGEEVGDHGDWWHGRTLYEESIRVPLVVRFPGGESAGRVVDRPVSGIDLMPEILRRAGVVPPPGLDGAGLFAEPRPVRASLETHATLEAWIDADEKLIRDTAAARSMLFDLAADPGEANDLAPRHAATRLRLERDLARALLDAPTFVAEKKTLDPEHVEKLRALGYVN